MASLRPRIGGLPQEVLMRILALAIFWTISISPAAAQTYSPGYPFCLRAQGNYECNYTTLARISQRLGASELRISESCCAATTFATIQGSPDADRV